MFPLEIIEFQKCFLLVVFFFLILKALNPSTTYSGIVLAQSTGTASDNNLSLTVVCSICVMLFKVSINMLLKVSLMGLLDFRDFVQGFNKHFLKQFLSTKKELFLLPNVIQLAVQCSFLPDQFVLQCVELGV